MGIDVHLQQFLNQSRKQLAHIPFSDDITEYKDHVISKVQTLKNRISDHFYEQPLSGIDITGTATYVCKILEKDSHLVRSQKPSECIHASFLSQSQEQEQLADNDHVYYRMAVTDAVVRHIHLPIMDAQATMQAITSRYLFEKSIDNANQVVIFWEVFGYNHDDQTQSILYVAAPQSKITPYEEHLNSDDGTITHNKETVIDLRHFHFYDDYVVNNPEQNAHVMAFININPHDQYVMIIDYMQPYLYPLDIPSFLCEPLFESLEQSEHLTLRIHKLVQHFVPQIEGLLHFHQTHHNNVSDHYQLVSQTAYADDIASAVQELLTDVTVSHCMFIQPDTLELGLEDIRYNATTWFGLARDQVLEHGTAFCLMIVGCIMLSMMMVTYSNQTTQHNLELQQQLSLLEHVESEYRQKKQLLTERQQSYEQLTAFEHQLDYITPNQGDVLAMYHYLNLSITDGVWFESIAFEAPNNVIIKGGAVDDESITNFIETLNSSEVFEKVALKDMSSRSKLDRYRNEQVYYRVFTLSGALITANDQ